MSGETELSPFAGDDTELGRHRIVQELVANDGEEVPEEYIVKESQREDATSASVQMIDLPVVDLHRLLTSSSSELQNLHSALTSWGYFQVINHGIETSLLDELEENGRQFFKLPMEEKQKCLRGENDLEGYGNDMVLHENQTLDWNDRILLCVNPEDNRKLHCWPQDPKSFREVLEEYTRRTGKMAKILLRSMAKSLDLAENSFIKHYGERPVLYARYNLYPPCPRPDLVQGLKAHADGTALTVILPDEEVEGLQILKDDQWVPVRAEPRALVVNVGDQVEMMSNGIFKSPIHRVMANKEKERMSVAMFCLPGVGEEAGPVEELVTEERPRMYRTVKDYPELFFKNFQQGKRPIEAVKL